MYNSSLRDFILNFIRYVAFFNRNLE